MDFPLIAGLTGVAFVAGFVDAIGGGGGLLTIPALLAAGLPPQLAIGTNKGAAVFGSASALLRYARSGLIDQSSYRANFTLAVVGATTGALLLFAIEPEVLRPLVIVLLIVAAVGVFRYRPRGPSADKQTARTESRLCTGIFAAGMGVYDGFFGPGTGTFLIAGLTGMGGFSLRGATANAKVINFGSNLAATAIFAMKGTILWEVSLPMALAQVFGATLGARAAIRGGDRLIKTIVLGVLVAVLFKLGIAFYRAPWTPSF